MRTNRIAAVPAAALLAVTALTACGSDDKAKDAATNATDTAKSAGSNATSAGSNATDSATSGAASATNSASESASSGSASSNASDASSSCPTEGNTKALAKTRFAADLGLAAGSFKHWIYDPATKKHSFDKNRPGGIDKSDAAKAAIVAFADYKLLKNAAEDAKANPTLCKTIAQPLSDAMDKLGDFKNINPMSIVTGGVGGNAANLMTAVGAFGSIKQAVDTSNAKGAQVQESTDFSQNNTLGGAVTKFLGK